MVTVYVYLGLQEMANTDIVGAALAGSLELVCQALKAGVPVDTTNKVREWLRSQLKMQKLISHYRYCWNLYIAVGIYSYSLP